MRWLSRWDSSLLPERAAALPFPACWAGLPTPRAHAAYPPVLPVPPCAVGSSAGDQGRGEAGGSPSSAPSWLQHLPDLRALPWDVAAGFIFTRAAVRPVPHCPHPQPVAKRKARAKTVAVPWCPAPADLCIIGPI